MEYVTGHYFYKEVFKNIYLIGCTFTDNNSIEKSWLEMEDKFELGKATGNSWLIIGENKAILIDSAAPVRGLREFAEKIAKVPIMFVVSHGHYDHVFCLEEFDEFWIHKEDVALLYGKFGFPPYNNIPNQIHYLNHGDIIDLGHRPIEIINIEGHSNGSILLLDIKSKVIFTGDSIARRLLFFDIDTNKIKHYIYQLNEIKRKDFLYICSCHDRVPLSKTYIEFMLTNLIMIKNIKITRKLFDNQFGEFYSLKIGNEMTEEFLNCSIISDYRDALVEVLEEIAQKGN